MMSVPHAKAVVAKQRFDGDRRSLPNPFQSFALLQSGHLRHVLRELAGSLFFLFGQLASSGNLSRNKGRALTNLDQVQNSFCWWTELGDSFS